jgi:WD40 repeat protein
MSDTRVRKVTIFVSSPKDVAPERGRVQAVTAKLNREYEALVRFETVLWEEHFYTADKSFQPQIRDPVASDIVVSIFWTRIGTELPADFSCMANGKPYPSGTAYELLTALEASKAKGVPDVYVFRKTADATLPMADPERRRQAQAQLDALEAFWGEWFLSEKGEFKAAFQNFPSTDAFEQQVELLLRQWLETRGLLGPRIAWPKEKGSPFPGLAPFEAEHAAVFFGRDRGIDEARRRLAGAAERGSPFLLIVGASGSGKSSLARAGLIPRLTTPGLVASVDLWRVARMKPGEGQAGPLMALATALLAGEGLSELAHGDYPTAASLADNLRRGGNASVQPIISALARVAEDAQRERHSNQAPKPALVLLVDQFEELFAQGVNDAEREAFAESLRQLIATGRVWVVATLRADLYELLLKQPVLKALKETSASLDLGPPGPAELAEIVRAPAAAAGLVFETHTEKGELGERLLADAKTADSLPLLQFTLRQLYERREEIEGKARLTHAAYDQLGGLAGAIAAEAERAVSSLPPQAVAALPRLLRQLAEPARGGKALTLREVSRADVAGETSEATLVDALLMARILIARTDADGRPTVRLAHDAVLASWPRASEAAQASRDFYRVRGDVEDALRRWQEHARPKDRLIQPGVPLAEAEKLVTDFGAELPAELTDYVTASRRRARRRQQFERAAAVFFFGLATAATGAGVWAYWERDRAFLALRQRDLSHQALLETNDKMRAKVDELQVMQSRLLADRANQSTADGDAATAMLLALEALPDRNSDKERPFVPEAEAALFKAYQVLRESVVLKEHSGPLWSASFAPDGRRLVTVSEDGTGRVWDTQTGAVLAVLRGHQGPVRFAAFSPDSQYVVTTSVDKTARVWNVEMGGSVAVLEGHSKNVLKAAFSPDGKHVATASVDNMARVWESLSGKEICKLEGHTAPVRDAIFTTDGENILTISDDATARLWDAATGRSIRVFKGHTGPIRSATVSPDTLPTSHLLVTASADKTVGVWVLDKSEPFSTFSGHDANVWSVTFSASGQHIVTASDDGTARVWDIKTEAIRILAGHTEPVTSAVFSGDRRNIVTGSKDSTARIWDAQTGKLKAVLSGHRGHVRTAVFSPDGARVLTASADGTARLWNVEPQADASIVVLTESDEGIRTAAFSRDRRLVVTGANNGAAIIWDAETGMRLTVLRRHKAHVSSVMFDRDGKRVVTGSHDGTARISDAQTGKELAVLRENDAPVRTAVFSPDGLLVATASDTARLWNAQTGDLLMRLVGHQGEINGAAFTADGKRVVTLGADRTFRVWDAQTGKEVVAPSTLSGEDHQVGTHRAAIRPDLEEAVTVGGDNTLRLWNLKTGQLLAALEGHQGSGFGVAYSPNGKRIATASADNTVRIWDADTRNTVAVLEGAAPMWDVAFSADGKRLVTASEDRTARVWPVFSTTQVLVDHAKSVVPRCLTQEQRRQAFLEVEPPAWCIAEKKWPYHAAR